MVTNLKSDVVLPTDSPPSIGVLLPVSGGPRPGTQAAGTRPLRVASGFSRAEHVSNGGRDVSVFGNYIFKRNFFFIECRKQ